MNPNPSIIDRKRDHVNLTLQNYSRNTSPWRDVSLIHDCLSEENYKTINLKSRFDKIDVSFPIVCIGMTGGYPEALTINQNLAKIASEFQIPMGVGSQRVMLEYPETSKTFSIIRDYDIPVRIGNIGMTHVGGNKVHLHDIYHLMEKIDANYMAIHLNVLQEICQKEGHLDIIDGIEKLRSLVRDIPIVIKETGAGISREAAKTLNEIGVPVVDCAGHGGTNFAQIELSRKQKIGNNDDSFLSEWGIPSPVSIREVSEVFSGTIIGSGGIHNGYDAAKALALGADFSGLAGSFLQVASISEEKTREFMEKTIKQIQTCMILTGSKNVQMLQKTRKIYHGRIRNWINE